MKKDNFQAIFNILSQLILNGTNFVLIMIFTRFLSTSDYGKVSIFQAYALFFAIIVGLNIQGSIGTAFVHIDEKERNNYLEQFFQTRKLLILKMMEKVLLRRILYLMHFFMKPNFRKFMQEKSITYPEKPLCFMNRLKLRIV